MARKPLFEPIPGLRASDLLITCGACDAQGGDPCECPKPVGTPEPAVAQSQAVAQDVSQSDAEAICREEVSLGCGRGIAPEYVAPLLTALDTARAETARAREDALSAARGFVRELAAATRRAEVAEARVRELEPALSGICAWVTTHGFIENHGHRKPGSACAECAALNAGLRALGEEVGDG